MMLPRHLAGNASHGKWISVLLAAAGVAFGAEPTTLRWDKLPALPPAAGQREQPGVAGPFVGVHAGALMVAGGANFPDALPWDGGKKIWWDDIWVLEKTPDGAAQWMSDRSFKLPRRLGYGVSVSVPEGVICAGGHDAERCYADVFLLSWDQRAREIRRTALPAMPQPLTFMAGAVVGRTLFVAGGQHTMNAPEPTTVFWSLDLSKRDRPEEFVWRVRPAWPGPARILAVAAASSTRAGEAFLLFSGRAPRLGKPTEILSDAYAFDPAKNSWRTLSPVGGGAGVSVMAAASVTLDDGRVLIFGGDRGDLFLELERHDLAIAKLRAGLPRATAEQRTAIQTQIDDHLRAKRAIYERHPGFAREVAAYQVQQDTWEMLTRAPGVPPVTTSAVWWDGAVIIPSGEVRPGVRTAEVIRLELNP